MTQPKWKDETSFSRGETDRTPKTWVLKIGTLRLVVTRHIHFKPYEWVTTCNPFFDNRRLSSMEVDDAKTEALEIVREYLKTCLADVEAVI